MKITTSKQINPYLLGKRLIGEYTYSDYEPESNDGMRRGGTHTVHCDVYGTLENEIKNDDGTYSYEYTSQVTENNYSKEPRKPDISEHDLKEMVYELIFFYNIHDFSTDLQEKPFSIKDYYADIKSTTTYEKGKEPTYTYKYSIKSKDGEEYTQVDDTDDDLIKSESIDEVIEEINCDFDEEDFILYLLGEELEFEDNIMLGLDEIGNDETVEAFLKRITIEPVNSSIEKALADGKITMEDLKRVIRDYESLSAEKISPQILEQLFSEDPELITSFDEQRMPIDILRKYIPGFDITKVSPNDLIPSDLDNVLQKIIQSHLILGIYNGPSEKELKQGYWEYLQSFYDDPDALRKIIPVINTSRDYFFRSQAQNFISQISPELMDTTEIRDLLLDTDSIDLSQLLKYEFDYDKDSAKKLMRILSDTTSKISLKNVNSVLNILQQNGINSNDMLQVLRENGFNIRMNEQESIDAFKSFGIEGITIDDLRDTILKEKDFAYFKLVDELDPKDVTREYNSLLNELANQHYKTKDRENTRYEEIFELMCNYSNSTELFSRLTPEVKEITKRLMIDNLDIIEVLRKKPIEYNRNFSMIMRTMTDSFEITEKDMSDIYTKCLNNGASREAALFTLKKYLPEEKREKFTEKIKRANIYPNPKYFWLTDKDLKRIQLNRGENRSTIKSKIQADGRCFSTRLTTDMVGKSKDGKKIVVNNLSKWLFGVPGERGKLTITRAGDYIQLPKNTPDETVELIKGILQERTNDTQSR